MWVGSHAEASAADASAQETTGGAITSHKEIKRRVIPGVATSRTIMAITGPAHEVTTADCRVVGVAAQPLVDA